ncbi:M20/M25/M40 family metallo-hydrolase [bacterium 210820-DFI.6.52]|nr:M20/M25/M40 family metallo-hydrolase [bacterium 210820-DFI.6.52]
MLEKLPQTFLDYVEENCQVLIDLIADLCAIPAPSHNEGARADFCKRWFEAHGAQGVYIDEALNVVYPYGCKPEGEVMIFMAHTDTVFPDLEPFAPRCEGGKMYCPGVGDDTANLAVLMMLAAYVTRQGLQADCGVLFVANSCEEGLGNLKGSRQLAKDYAGRIRQVVSFDGYYLMLCNGAVGSQRYRVEIKTEGGHSYGNFGNRNAIACLASMIDTLYTVKAPTGGRTTYNVGTISGGTSVNTIAQNAEMLYEFRSDCREDLAFMQNFFEKTVECYRAMGIEVEVELLGERPCTGDVDPAAQRELEDRCLDAIEQFTGKRVEMLASSTDCNIPLSQGIPAACFGVCTGGGAHTRGEWIDLESLPTGMKIAGSLVLSYFHN